MEVLQRLAIHKNSESHCDRGQYQRGEVMCHDLNHSVTCVVVWNHICICIIVSSPALCCPV